MKGDQLRAYYQIRDLSTHFEVYLISLSDEKVTENQLQALKPYCKHIEVFPLSRWKILIHLGFNIFFSKPFQVAYFFQQTIYKQIQQRILQIRPDHIFSQLVRTTEYVKNYHACPKTIDYMDALSKGMERRYDLNRNKFGFLFRIESLRLKKYEREVFDYFEHQTIISNQDQKYIYHPDYQKICVIPNGIDDSFFENKKQNPQKDIVFVGNMSYAPNLNAAEYLYREIHLKNPKLRIQISGASPSKKIMQLSNKNFEVTGFFTDIREAYSNAKIFVAPLFIGTGMQNKIMEAMAQGLPCVTTSLVNNAIGAVPNKEILLAETPEEFLSAIRQLLSDDHFYQGIRQNAIQFVQAKYSWHKINESLYRVMSLPM